MSKGSAPAAPDYEAAARETAAGNLAAARYATQANRPTQITPWGSSVWTSNRTFDQAGYDDAMARYQQQLAAYNQGMMSPAVDDTPEYLRGYGDVGIWGGSSAGGSFLGAALSHRTVTVSGRVVMTGLRRSRFRLKCRPCSTSKIVYSKACSAPRTLPWAASMKRWARGSTCPAFQMPVESTTRRWTRTTPPSC